MEHSVKKYIIKHNKKKDKELKYDFMPDLLELIERPAHKAGTIIILGIFSLLAATIIWANLSKIDVVILASGDIQPSGNIKIVQAYVAGTVERINVADGEYVKEGDTLVELSTDGVQVDESWLGEQKKLYEAQVDVYGKMISGEDVSQLDLNAYDEETRPTIQAMINTDQSYQNVLLNLENNKKAAEYEQEIAEIQLEEYEEENEKEAQKLLIQKYKLEIEQYDIQINDASLKYNAQINVQLSEAKQKVLEINAQLDKTGITKKYQKLIAPVSGYVNNLEVNTVGASVSSTQQIATIVPDHTPLEVVCYVKNMDIADIKKNMSAEIKLEAYPYTKYGTVKGKVKYISPSSFYNEKMGNIYVVKLDIDNTNTEINIISGLSGTVEIKTGKRTVMDYFTEPIRNGFQEALREK